MRSKQALANEGMRTSCIDLQLPDAAIDRPQLLCALQNVVNPGAILRMSLTNQLRFALIDLMS